MQLCFPAYLWTAFAILQDCSKRKAIRQMQRILVTGADAHKLLEMLLRHTQFLRLVQGCVGVDIVHSTVAFLHTRCRSLGAQGKSKTQVWT